jgi:hypothetical protein
VPPDLALGDADPDDYRNAALACRAYAVREHERASNPAFMSPRKIFEESAAAFDVLAVKLEKAAPK